MEDRLLEFKYQKDKPKIIKVVGVGGGGGNAVSHMYKEGIFEVSFVLCNTDMQALEVSDIPNKLVLGQHITQGLGAGSKPEKARMAAEESEEDIKSMLNDGTKMVFVTAGMGGGTGTGAAPIIAKYAKEMGILTVGIVTIPFGFEGEDKIVQALEGVERMSRSVDALLVINNECLSKLYPELNFVNAFGKADDTLTIAAKSIAEIITVSGYINLDFADVETTVKDGGVALMSNGYGEGEGRLMMALEDAIVSPLLNNSNIFKAKKVLLNISFSHDSQVKMEEFKAIDEFMSRFERKPKVIWGAAFDDSLGSQAKITLLATGFGVDDIPEMAEKHAQMMSEEEYEQLEKQAQEEERKKKLIKKYYGANAEKSVGSQRKIVVLSEKELDDDQFISFIEDNATYDREMRKVIQLRSKAVQPAPQEKTNVTDASQVRITQAPPNTNEADTSAYKPRNKNGSVRFG